MSEEPELTTVIISLIGRINSLEAQIAHMQQQQLTQEITVLELGQLDELTRRVEQNITRKLRQRMGSHDT